jgi:hypothetical protein
VTFGSVILAFSLFGFLWPHRADTLTGRHHINFQMQESAADWDHDEDGFYTPTRSPGWNDLFH